MPLAILPTPGPAAIRACIRVIRRQQVHARERVIRIEHARSRPNPPLLRRPASLLLLPGRPLIEITHVIRLDPEQLPRRPQQPFRIPTARRQPPRAQIDRPGNLPQHRVRSPPGRRRPTDLRADLPQLIQPGDDVRVQRLVITTRGNRRDLIQQHITVPRLEYLPPVLERHIRGMEHPGRLVDVDRDRGQHRAPSIQGRERVVDHARGLAAAVLTDVGSDRQRPPERHSSR